MVKAVVCSEHGLPDKLSLAHDWETPALGAHDVRMDVKAAGLNFPDVLIIQGKYQMQPPMPFVPGGESAGIVTEVGSAGLALVGRRQCDSARWCWRLC
jgi:NADPH2:quinone reductase